MNGEIMKNKKIIIIFGILIIVISFILFLLYKFNYIPHKKYTNADFNIETYISKIEINE